MERYSNEFKIKLVLEYLNNSISYRSLAAKYNMKSYSLIREWVKQYEYHGLNGLKRKREINKYPVQFKLDAVEYMIKTGATSLETAIQFNLSSSAIVRKWHRDFCKNGVDGLNSISKGQSVMSKKTNKNNPKQTIEYDREMALERENELLKIEVAYLKKLKAFREKTNASHEKRRQK